MSNYLFAIFFFNSQKIKNIFLSFVDNIFVNRSSKSLFKVISNSLNSFLKNRSLILRMRI